MAGRAAPMGDGHGTVCVHIGVAAHVGVSGLGGQYNTVMDAAGTFLQSAENG